MTQSGLIAFSKHLRKRHAKRQSVRIPAMSGNQLEIFLRTLERVRGYSV
ncbi:hypothetical protein [Photorhabdus heterorhabditis]|nr:hypothetical protein [Photorhabdus heterorhabditis]